MICIVSILSLISTSPFSFQDSSKYSSFIQNCYDLDGPNFSLISSFLCLFSRTLQGILVYFNTAVFWMVLESSFDLLFPQSIFQDSSNYSFWFQTVLWFGRSSFFLWSPVPPILFLLFEGLQLQLLLPSPSLFSSFASFSYLSIFSPPLSVYGQLAQQDPKDDKLFV